jgi:hypothetical protein
VLGDADQHIERLVEGAAVTGQQDALGLIETARDCITARRWAASATIRSADCAAAISAYLTTLPGTVQPLDPAYAAGEQIGGRRLCDAPRRTTCAAFDTCRG